MVLSVPEQKAVQIAHLLTDEVIPNIGILEALFSNWGTNLLSHLNMGMCNNIIPSAMGEV